MTMKVSMYFENLQLSEADVLLEVAKRLRKDGAAVTTLLREVTPASGFDMAPIDPVAEPEVATGTSGPDIVPIKTSAEPEVATEPSRPSPTPAVQAEIDNLLGADFDWTQITGTGKGGKVTQTDVRKFHKSAAQTATRSAPAVTGNTAEPVVPGPAETGVSIDDARAALKRVSDDKGMDDAIALLQSFGVSKISDIPAARLADFVEQAAL